MIAWTIYITFAGALLLLVLPCVFARWIALLATIGGLSLGVITFIRTPIAQLSHFSTIVRVPWVPALGMNYHLAIDGITLTMLLVTGISAVSTVLFSWDVEHRQNEFFFWLLLVVAGCYGVFLSADLFLLFAFYELVIVPKYFLIAVFGSTDKEYGAMKLTLYSFSGGMFVFAGILAAYATAGSLDLNELARFQFPAELQAWAFPVLFLGFAVLAGIWPLHTWAPTGHVAAPTAGSMLLAGIVMKLGSYAALRVAMNLFPQGFQMWSRWIAVLAVVGIVYAAAVALRQRDLKFVIGYSSVSHMGFVLLGLSAATALSVSGAVLQMFSHGVIAALLFAVAGRMIYRRTHTRELDVLAGMNLSQALPFAAFTFVVASAASMGIPGFSGFAAEITILIGAWRTYPVAVWITGAGMVLGAAFTLRALKQSFFGETRVSVQQGRVAVDTDWNEQQSITLAEKIGACLLMFTTLAIGLYPKILLDRMMPAVESMRFLK
ncbi:MAG TPA: NADH-quinone oxidoreductase subunit M [Candidatus Udaeobacter sp.]|jgi:NADH-quinone oxidoreductase subunit M|nr:NADH-quinone oxidoreductase subunit M [Candidatus Udaeobacter sp.]